MHVTIDEPKVYSRRQAAELLGLSVSSLAKMAKEGRGPTYCRSGDVRGRVWYRPVDLSDWLESRRQTGSR